LRQLSVGWPGEERVGLLCTKASGLFIFASTACNFIGARGLGRDPEQRLSIILQNNNSKSSREIDKMYMSVIKNSLLKDDEEGDVEDLFEHFKRIVGSIIILFDTLTLTVLARLLSLGESNIRSILDYLSSVVDVSHESSSTIRLLHPSFRDFLLDEKRCTDHRFWIDERKMHYELVLTCLDLMKKSLKRDICDLRVPGASINDCARVENYLPLEVQYACRYWIHHLELSAATTLYDEVYAFLNDFFLYWLEALSLMGQISEGVLLLKALESHLTVNLLLHPVLAS
jgi:hypothetical protein